MYYILHMYSIFALSYTYPISQSFKTIHQCVQRHSKIYIQRNSHINQKMYIESYLSVNEFVSVT